MFSIGEFARHGRISVRMLRHYDALGVLVPTMVDPVSGYRFYQAGQLSRLNRIIALRDLGFSLSTGYPRELTIEHSDDSDQWVTELQEPVAPAAGSARDESRLDSSS
jgi:DNA-binding transcriptional MerR regulator